MANALDIEQLATWNSLKGKKFPTEANKSLLKYAMSIPFQKLIQEAEIAQVKTHTKNFKFNLSSFIVFKDHDNTSFQTSSSWSFGKHESILKLKGI